MNDTMEDPARHVRDEKVEIENSKMQSKKEAEEYWAEVRRETAKVITSRIDTFFDNLETEVRKLSKTTPSCRLKILTHVRFVEAMPENALGWEPEGYGFFWKDVGHPKFATFEGRDGIDDFVYVVNKRLQPYRDIGLKCEAIPYVRDHWFAPAIDVKISLI